MSLLLRLSFVVFVLLRGLTPDLLFTHLFLQVFDLIQQIWDLKQSHDNGSILDKKSTQSRVMCPLEDKWWYCRAL